MDSKKGAMTRVIMVLLLALFAVVSSQNMSNDGENNLNGTGAFLESCENQDCPVDDQSNQSGKACYCDRDCVRYGDCCFDSPLFNMTQQIQARKHLTCMRTNSSSGIYVINHCPSDWNDPEVLNKCEQNQGDEGLTPKLPVLGIESRTAYSNVHCAICNGARLIEFLNTRLECQETDERQPSDADVADNVEGDQPNTTRSTTARRCSKFSTVSVMPPGAETGFVRGCVPDLVGSCASGWTDDQIRNQCESFTSFYRNESAVFRNQYCAFCNGRSVLEKSS